MTFNLTGSDMWSLNESLQHLSNIIDEWPTYNFNDEVKKYEMSLRITWCYSNLRGCIEDLQRVIHGHK